MLKNNKFDLSPELFSSFRDIMREVVKELKSKDSLYAKTLGEYLNQLGKILFAEPFINEAEMVQFMSLVSEYQVNQEFLYDDIDEDEIE